MHHETMTYITQIYCENSNCNVREVEVLTKDHGDQPEPLVWSCPGCGMLAKLHWRRTLLQHSEIELNVSIGRVNAALYGRDYPEDIGVPASVAMLKSLPEAWKAQKPEKAEDR